MKLKLKFSSSSVSTEPHAALNVVLPDTVRSLNNTVGSHNREKTKRDGVCADRRRRQKK